ncbi:MAG: di-trans,poly-cis-decaprenylcistransferase [Hamadaea sp.]|nr:di-trans,poly-cis-decaprenylcistransferase [Hamadaea sp.]
MRDLAYRLYAARLRRGLRGRLLPRHVAVVMDGNRRWAREVGYADPRVGHRHGAEHVDDLLRWCAELDISHVTVYVCSVDNLRKRDSDEVLHLMRMIEEVVAERVRRTDSQWRLHVAGRLDALPESTRDALKRAADETRDRTQFHLTIAIGYDGRAEIADAVRSLLDARARAGETPARLAESLTAEDIAAHLYTTGQPDPDLVIRTSGEQRLSGFLIWQAAHAELYFCDAYWPGFRHVDFLRALRAYGSRQRRFGA